MGRAQGRKRFVLSQVCQRRETQDSFIQGRTAELGLEPHQGMGKTDQQEQMHGGIWQTPRGIWSTWGPAKNPVWPDRVLRTEAVVEGRLPMRGWRKQEGISAPSGFSTEITEEGKTDVLEKHPRDKEMQENNYPKSRAKGYLGWGQVYDWDKAPGGTSAVALNALVFLFIWMEILSRLAL